MVRDMIALFPLIFLLSATANVEIKLAQGRPDPQIVTVNVGDTVTWTAVVRATPNFVEEFGGAWKSPILSGAGDTFSITASTPGFYAYRTMYEAGTITVRPQPNSPRVVSINSPSEGIFVDGVNVPIDASISGNGADISKLDIYVDERLVGSASSPPYRAIWNAFNVGSFQLTAVATEKSGLVWKSEPVTVNVDVFKVSHPHILPDGSFLCYYSMLDIYACMRVYDAVLTCFEFADPGIGAGYGVFVDTRATNHSNRFYSPVGCNPPFPCTPR